MIRHFMRHSVIGVHIRTQSMGVAVLIALAGFLVLSCKQGDPLPDESVAASAAFRPDSVTASSRFVALRKGRANGGRIVLDVVVTDVDEPVTAIAMKLSYPSSFSRFVKCTDGDLFQVSAPCYF